MTFFASQARERKRGRSACSGANYDAARLLIFNPTLSDEEVSAEVEKHCGKRLDVKVIYQLRRSVDIALTALAEDKRGAFRALREYISTTSDSRAGLKRP